MQRAWQSGITVVVAAGNDGRDDSMKTKGYSTITSPANSPYVISVGIGAGAARAENTSTGLFSGNRADVSAATYSSKGPSLID